MNKQKTSTNSTSENGGRDITMQDRFYVQSVTAQIFVIRERILTDSGAESNDRIVKSFDTRHDAYAHVELLNEQQRKRDAEKQEG